MSQRDEVRPHDEERRIAEIYRKAPRDEPPPHLDETIARAAARGTGRRAREKRPWWFAWRLPLALAAVSIVSVSLVALMIDEGRERVAPAASERPARTAPARPPAVQRESVVPEKQVGEPQTAEGRLRAPAPRTDSSQARPSAAATPVPAPGETPAPAVTKQPPSAAEQVPLPAQQRPGPETPTPAAGASPALPPNEPSAAPPERASSDAATAPDTGAAAPARSREAPAMRQEDRSGGPSAPRAVVPAPAAKPAPRREGRPQPSARDEGRVKELIADLEDRPIRDWMERISALRREGRHTEADAVAAEFRKRFPNETLPPALR